MLEGTWPGNRPFFGDVADQKNRNRAVLGKQKELGSDLTDLRDRSGRRLDLGRESCLDRVNDHRRRLQTLDFTLNVFEVRLRQEQQVRGFNSQPLTAQFDLAFRLFA